MRFSSPGVPPSSGASGSLQSRPPMLLSCVRKLQSYWRRIETVPLGLLHMRPLQHWLYGRIPRWAWKRGTYRVQITPACSKTFGPWSDPSFLRAGVPLEQVSRHAVVKSWFYHSMSAARLLSENMINAVHRLPLILTLWSAAAGCNDRMPMSIGTKI